MSKTVLGIMSYPTLFTPKQVGKPGQKTGDPKFSVNILLPKNDPQVAEIQALIQEQVTLGLAGVMPEGNNHCFKDCAKQYPDQPALANFMELRTNSGASNKPHVVDTGRQPIVDSSLVYGGAEAYFDVNIAFYTTGTNGVGCWINGVLLTGNEGALGRLDNKQSADAMFAGVGAGGAQPPVSTPPAAPGAPAAKVMTAKAAGGTYEAFIGQGWKEADLIAQGYMEAPVAAPPTPPAPAAAPQPPAPTPPAPAPQPPAPAPQPPAPAPVAVHQMTPTATAAGYTYEALQGQGWSDDQMIQAGHLVPPGGVTTAY